MFSTSIPIHGKEEEPFGFLNQFGGGRSSGPLEMPMSISRASSTENDVANAGVAGEPFDNFFEEDIIKPPIENEQKHNSLHKQMKEKTAEKSSKKGRNKKEKRNSKLKKGTRVLSSPNVDSMQCNRCKYYREELDEMRKIREESDRTISLYLDLMAKLQRDNDLAKTQLKKMTFGFFPLLCIRMKKSTR